MTQLIKHNTDHIGGRPSVAKGVQLSYVWNTRLNDLDNDVALRKCNQSGLTKSEFIRQAITGASIKERLDPEMRQCLKQIGGMGNNINQLAHRANAEGLTSCKDMAEQALSQLLTLMTQVQKQ